MTILIIAPHQDDEILSSCLLIQERIEKGDQVYIAFATNGDYRGRHVGRQRYQESLRALRMLHFPENHIFYMGYGDTGMRYERSFLLRLYYGETERVVPTPVSERTYHPAGKETLHFICTGRETSYCRRHFLCDLRFLLNVCKADLVVLPSGLDRHGDHRACYLFMRELLGRQEQKPALLTYLLHAGNDTLWPNRGEATFSRPPIARKLWEQRLVLRASEEARRIKLDCINCFRSQQPEALNNYLLSFAKREEIFFPAFPGHPIINIFP